MATDAIKTSDIAKIKIDPSQRIRSRSHWSRALDRLKKDYLTLTALGVIALFTLLAVTAPMIGNHILHQTPTGENLYNIYAQPNAEHLLGTDQKGRDHLTRLLYAGGVSLKIAYIAAAISLTIGVALGLISGYYRGVVDDVLVWLVTTLNSIPNLFLLIIIASVLNPGEQTLILILGFLGWTGTLRLVRGETLSLREREFVLAARAMGASGIRIMVQHILPNLLSIVIITLAIDIGVLILTETVLSFLGFGVAPPTPSWGNMLTNAQADWKRVPLLAIMPGLLITITVLCMYVIGDGIRDALDPTTRE
jgi:peptide/nickel transport system permease protein